MAGVKISDLDLVVQLNDSDYIPLARGAETKKIEGKRIASNTALTQLSSTTTTKLAELSAYVDVQISELQDSISEIDGGSGTYSNLYRRGGVITDVFVSSLSSHTNFELYGLENLSDYSTNSAAYRVVVDGIAQEPEYSYDISGKTIAFTVPVPQGSRVAVTYKKASPTFNPVINTFLGTGSQQNFTLVGFPVSPDSTLARVTVDGVLQEANDDYVIASSLLSFVTPPPYEAKIVVVSEDVFHSSSVVKAKHIATGLNANFTVPGISLPYSDPAAYRVDVDGVIQEPGNGYVIVNESEVSFATAPAAGTKVVIITTSKSIATTEPQTGATVFLSHSVLTSSVFVPPRMNAMSIGPITIPTGVTLTVSPEAVYTVVL